MSHCPDIIELNRAVTKYRQLLEAMLQPFYNSFAFMSS